MSILNRISDDFHNKKAANAINNLQVLFEALSDLGEGPSTPIKNVASTALTVSETRYHGNLTSIMNSIDALDTTNPKNGTTSIEVQEALSFARKDPADSTYPVFRVLSEGTPTNPASIDIIIETLKELYYILDQDDETREQVGTVLKALKILGFQSGI